MEQLKTPVVYLVYNRPKCVKRTFPVICSVKPRVLFLIADGPKPDCATDFENCSKVREILENIDWPCKVYRNYSESNMGLKKRVSSGLSWVFEHVSEAIILEDDCLPHPEFFEFCEILLKRYESDERIWTVTGDNFQNGKRRGKASYYFSKYPHCWGWATWARAWKNYQGDIPFWPSWRESRGWKYFHNNRNEEKYWRAIFDKVYTGKINSWSYPWIGTVWYHNGLTATPNVNLVSNIGFGADGTHCLQNDKRNGMQVKSIGSCIHPIKIQKDNRADKYVFKNAILMKRAHIISNLINRFLKRVGLL
jgi:hypothetical protein